MDTTATARRRNRSWPEALKREIVAASFAPGSSVSMVARRYDVNTNQVFGWRKLYRDDLPTLADPPGPMLLPVHDVEVADELSLELAEANCSGLAMVWRYAAELVCQSDIGAAIEAVADALIHRSLDHAEVMRLCLGAGERRSAARPS